MSSTIHRAEPAAYHAQRCLDILQANNIGDWDLAFAYKALARAAMTANNKPQMQHYLELAHAAAKNITKAKDKELFDRDIATINCKIPCTIFAQTGDIKCNKQRRTNKCASFSITKLSWR